MNSTVTKYGLWSSLFLLGVFTIPLLFLGIPKPGDFMASEVVGHVFILLSLVFVFLGMKQYRETNGGHLSYWKAVKIGLLITIFPAVTFGLYNLLYVEVIDPEFMANYTNQIIADRSIGKTAEEANEIKKTVMAEHEMFSNPAIQFGVMFLSVFVMGIMVSLVSGFFVKKGNDVSLRGTDQNIIDNEFIKNV